MMYFQKNKLQKKMKVLFTPYNKSIIHQKHMSFEDIQTHRLIESNSLEEGQSWNRFYNLIIKEKKSDMRKFLTQVNKKFYSQLADKAMKDGRRKRNKVKFKVEKFSDKKINDIKEKKELKESKEKKEILEEDKDKFLAIPKTINKDLLSAGLLNFPTNYKRMSVISPMIENIRERAEKKALRLNKSSL
mmetsp:Transcript_5926/g.5086  ORF Transcript_5926/g.5086 Transcript_5926/m.5086 type:complete len:188 (+) Transcript_5926:178-741(+)